jgi:hypothetical protein
MIENQQTPPDTGSLTPITPIAEWAESAGQSPHTAIVLAGCVLAHIAGDSLMFLDASGLSGMAPPSFVGFESDMALHSILASLTGPIGRIQMALVLKAREYEQADIDEAMAESNRKYSMVRDDFGERAEENRTSFGAASDYDLGRDTRLERRNIRMESLSRQRFQMGGSPPENLGEALRNYHFACGFLAGGVERLPRDSRRRHQRLDHLERFVRGEEITLKSGSREQRVSASIGGIMFLPDEQFEWLLEERRDFFRLFVPIATDEPTTLPGHIDPAIVDEFDAMFFNEARRLIGIRRVYAAANAKFTDPACLARFMGLRRDFIRECSGLPTSLRSPSIMCLPDLVAWTLIRLGRGSLPEDLVCAHAFAAARHVRDGALRVFVAHDNAREAAARMKIASNMIRRLMRLGPTKRRELVRGFDNMKLSLHEPVIQVLIQIGVFVETEDRTLTIGQVPTKPLTPTLFIETPAIP